MRIDSLPRVHLASLPTALEDAPNLAAAIGIDRLLIKRDDNTGLALGGNKARKLEFLMADVIDQQADVILSCGGNQSNHARMTAAAARKLGLDCTLFLTNPLPEDFEGNLELNTILGARMVFIREAGMERLTEVMEAEAETLRSAGRTPYLIPVGGSTPLGSMGYVTAIRELAGELQSLGIDNPDIVHAVGSCGTVAGVVLGCDLFLPSARIFGISVSQPAAEIVQRVERIAPAAAELIQAEFSGKTRLKAYDEYIGRAYAVPTQEGKDAILLAAQTEGLILDPVYTGKAMAGLIDLARKGVIGRDRPVVFIHTGGSAGLFAFHRLFHEDAQALSTEI